MSSAAADPSLKKRCSRTLRKISPAHGILPKSYFPPDVTLGGATVPHSVKGGSADVWKGKQGEHQVCIKVFRTQTAANLEKIKRVCGSSLFQLEYQPNSGQRFYREIVAWKYVSHRNVVPFLGVSETLFPFSIISPWLPNGNIVEYIQRHEGADRLQLVSDRHGLHKWVT